MQQSFWRKGLIIVLLAGCVSACQGGIGGKLPAGRFPEGQPTARPEGEGWTELFGAAQAAGWKNVTDGNASVFELKDGVFHIFGKSGAYMAYEPETFGDFTLHIEFKVTRGANSGVFFRTDPKDPVQGGIEVQVLDDHGVAPNRNGSGAIYDAVTPMFNLARPAGEWNSYDITCRGSEVEVVMNGWRVIHTDLSQMTMPVGKFNTPFAELPRDGHIVLQDHGAEVWYKNLVIKRL